MYSPDCIRCDDDKPYNGLMGTKLAKTSCRKTFDDSRFNETNAFQQPIKHFSTVKMQPTKSSPARLNTVFSFIKRKETNI